MTSSEFRPIWITFTYSCVRYHKNAKQLWQNRHNRYPILAQTQSYCTCIKPLWWLITVHNMNKFHWIILAISRQTYRIYDIMDINATFWCRTKVYFTCIKLLLWVIIVPNMNKINPFKFWDIYRNKHKRLRNILA